MKRRIFAVVALAIGLAACGGGTKTGSPGTPDETSTPTNSTAPQAAKGGDCDFGKQYQDSSKALTPSPGATDPASIKKQMLEARDALAKSADLAPAAIRDDVKAVSAVYAKMITALEKYDFDYSKIPPSDFQSVFSFATDTSYLDAAKRISKYFAEKCGYPDPFASIKS